MRVRSSRFLLPALLWALPAVVSAQAAPPFSAADLGALRLRNIGPASMSGRVVDMDVVESNPSTWYVAGATGGLWRTEDNGVTWASTFDAPVHSIGDVAVFQPNPQIIWVGTGERASRQSVGWGDGVYKSTDGGKTWTALTNGLPDFSKGECERIVRESGLSWAVFRPSALASPAKGAAGTHGKRWVPPGATALTAGLRTLPGVGDLVARYGPIPIEVVARAMVRTVTTLAPGGEGRIVEGAALWEVGA